MNLFTANFGRGVSPFEYRANVRRVRKRFAWPVIGCQEIDEADEAPEHAILHEEIGEGYRYAEFTSHVPIAIPKDFQIERVILTPSCKGLPGYTPDRVIVQAKVRNLKQPSLPPFVLVNTHFPRKDPKLATRRRQCRDAMVKVLDRWYEQGVTTFYTGDFNTLDMSKFHRRDQRIVHAGLDYIGAVVPRGGVRYEVNNTGDVPLSIDGHNAHWANIRLLPAAA